MSDYPSPLAIQTGVGSHDSSNLQFIKPEFEFLEPTALGLQIPGIVASGSWHFWYANLSFVMLVGFTLASWGTLGRSWDIGEHNKGHLEAQAWIFINF